MEKLWTRPFTLSILSTGSVFVGMYLLIPALPPWAAKLGGSNTTVGLVVGIYSISALISRIFSGQAMDRHGRRPFLLFGLVIFTACVAGYSLTTSLSMLFAVRVLHGIAWGWITTALGGFVADLAPEERRGEAVGFWGIAPPAAMAAGPLVGGLLLASGGFTAVFLTGAVFGALALALALPIREPRGLVPRQGDLGFFSWGLLPATVLFLSSLAYGAILAFVPVELADRPERAGQFFTVYAIALVVSRPIAGKLADRLGRSRVIHPGLVMAAAGVALLGLGPSGNLLWLAAILYAFGVSGSFLGLMAWTVDLAPHGSRNRAMAGFFAAYDLAIAFGAFLFGPVYDRWGFATMGLVAATLIVASQILLWTRQRGRHPEPAN